MRTVSSIAAMQRLARQWQRAGNRIGFVPTMGYLHAGHLSLVREARKRVGRAGMVVVSIYVNPTQFGPKEDFSKYPRDLKRDLKLLRAGGVDAVFTPGDLESGGPISVSLGPRKILIMPYETWPVSPGDKRNAKAKGTVVTLSEAGEPESIFDKLNSRELLSGPSRLALLHEKPKSWPAWNMDWADRNNPPRAYVGGAAQIRVVESGPVRVALEIERETEGSRFIQTLRLSAGAAGDRVEIRIDGIGCLANTVEQAQ